MTGRLFRALLAYAVLLLLVTFTLDGALRLAMYVFLGGLVVKTLIAHKAGW
jgi:hypothetical protein